MIIQRACLFFKTQQGSCLHPWLNWISKGMISQKVEGGRWEAETLRFNTTLESLNLCLND